MRGLQSLLVLETGTPRAPHLAIFHGSTDPTPPPDSAPCRDPRDTLARTPPFSPRAGHVATL
jgi:hypothetical protein